jgi:hypothetical protein
MAGVRCAQNAFANPACFRTALAVCLDLILLSTVIGRRAVGQSQISWSPAPCLSNRQPAALRRAFTCRV